MHGGRSITISMDCTLLAASLWLTAVSLLAGDIFGAPDYLGRAAVLVGLAATCVTMNLVIKHHRRVVLEVMSYEFKLRDGGRDGDGSVLPMQRGLLAGTRTRLD